MGTAEVLFPGDKAKSPGSEGRGQGIHTLYMHTFKSMGQVQWKNLSSKLPQTLVPRDSVLQPSPIPCQSIALLLECLLHDIGGGGDQIAQVS